MQSIKLIVVGDGAIGKTAALITFAKNDFPGEYIPYVFDNHSVEMMYNGQPIHLSLWDTSGREDYNRLRPLSYPQTDVFLVGFSLVNPQSFANVSSIWVPEILHHVPNTPFVVGGFKLDLRDDKKTLDNLSKWKQSPITTHMGEQLAEDLGASGYMEFSSLTKQNLKQVFELCISAVFSNTKLPPVLPPKPVVPHLFKKQYSQSRWLSSLNDSILSSEGDLEFIVKDKVHNFQKINLVCLSQVFRDYFIDGRNGELFEEQVDNQQLSLLVTKKDRSNVWVQTYQSLTSGAEKGVDSSEGRYGHSCVVHDNILYAIGGVATDGSYLENMLRYDLQSRTWLEPLTWGKEVNFPKNNFHSTVQKQDGTILVFGGKSNGYNKDLWSFSIEDLDWKLLTTTGNVPSGRYGHTMVIDEENTKVYLFGGYDNEFGLSNDLYELDIGTMIWSAIKIEGECPEARYGHFSVLVKAKKGGNELLVFGGRGSKGVLDDIWIFDLKKSRWFELPVAGERPPGRYGFGAFVSDNEMFIFGGFDGKTVVYDDVWGINCRSSKRKWRQIENNGIIARYHQTINLTPNGIVIFGGRRADHTLCLYVEEGINRGKQFQIPELRSHIRKLTLAPKIVKRSKVTEWIKQISIVEKSFVQNNDKALRKFYKTIGEEISSFHTFQQNLVKFAVDASFFSDMEVKLLDSIEPAHSFYLKLNVDLLPTITKTMIEESKGAGKPLYLPFMKEEWLKLKQYLYTGTMYITSQNCKEFLLLSAKYQLKLLLKLCCDYYLNIDVYSIMEVGIQYKINPVIIYAIWYMRCNYFVVKDNPQFLALPSEIKQQVIEGYWPGKPYESALAAWRAENDKKNSNCAVQ